MWRAWLQAHITTFWWLGLLSALMFVGTLFALPLLIVRLPADYFTRPPRLPRRRTGWRAGRHVIGAVLKNCLGLLFLGAGIAMLVLPGQGILTILLGLTFLDFPGKRTLEYRLVQRPMVWQSLNWIRTRAHRPPLERPAPVRQSAQPGPRSPSRKQ